MKYYNGTAVSTLFYGLECWTLRKARLTNVSFSVARKLKTAMMITNQYQKLMNLQAQIIIKNQDGVQDAETGNRSMSKWKKGCSSTEATMGQWKATVTRFG